MVTYTNRKLTIYHQLRIMSIGAPLFITYLPKALILMICALLSFVASAKKSVVNFTEFTVTSAHPLTQKVIVANLIGENAYKINDESTNNSINESHDDKELLTFSVDDDGNRWLVIYQLDKSSNQYTVAEQAIIPQHFYRVDLSQANDGKLQKIYFLSANGVAIYQLGNKQEGGSQAGDTQKFIPVLTAKSLFVKSRADFLSRGNFIHDLNEDGIDDIVLTDFYQSHLYIGDAKGQLSKQSLPIPPSVRAFDNGATYTERNIYFYDINFDKRLDVLVINDGEMLAFEQLPNSQFNKNPTTIAINETISSTQWWNKRDEKGEKFDQSKLEYRVLEKLIDINADGIIDMVVRFTKASGVLDRVNDYEMYLGKKVNGVIAYDIKADSVISAEGTLTGMTFIDINNDEKQEVLLAGFDIGVSQVIAALLTGGIDQDVYVFKMDKNDKFTERSEIKKDVELTFSLSSGQTGSPVVKLADVNGDGLKDLVLSNDDDELKIYLALAKGKSKRSFARRSARYDTQLPKNGKLVVVADLNNDGKDDLLMRYSSLDGPELAQNFKVLFAN